MSELTDTIYPFLKIAIPPILAYIGAHVVQYKRYSGKFTQFRNVIDDLDNANQNPAITQDQFNKLIADSKALISK